MRRVASRVVSSGKLEKLIRAVRFLSVDSNAHEAGRL